MNEIYIEKHKAISNKLGAAEAAYSDMLGALRASEPYADPGFEQRLEQIELRCAALRSIRIALEYELGVGKLVLRRELTELIGLLNSCDLNGGSLSGAPHVALDCICCVLGEAERPKLAKALPLNQRRLLLKAPPAPDSVFYTVIQIAAVFEEEEKYDAAADVLRNAEYMLQIRSQDEEESFRDCLFITLLRKALDYAPNACAQLFDEFEQVFEDGTDFIAAEFFWQKGAFFSSLQQFEKADDSYERSYELRRQILGGEHWLSRLTEAFMALNRMLIDEESIDNNIEIAERFVIDYDEGKLEPDEGFEDRFNMEAVVGAVLGQLLIFKTDRSKLSNFEQLLEIYESFCSVYNDDAEQPLVKQRMYYNFLGGLRFYKMDLIGAEKAFHDALNTPFPEGTPEMIQKETIESNLLSVYILQHDIAHALELVDDIAEFLDSDDCPLTEKDRCRLIARIFSLYENVEIGVDEDQIAFVREVADAITEEVEELAKAGEITEIWNIELLFVSIELLLQYVEPTKEEYARCYRTLMQIEADSPRYRFGVLMRYFLYLLLAAVALEADPDRVYDHTRAFLDPLDSGELPLHLAPHGLRLAAVVFMRNGRNAEAKYFIGRSLERITELWHSLTRYCNDERLTKILQPAQLIFETHYTMLHSIDTPEALYDKVLRFKALASLAGRERNKALNSGAADQELVARIRALQDRIAAAEAQAAFLKTDADTAALREELRALEMQFEKRFPEKLRYTEIDLQSAAKALPGNSAVLEYYLFYTDVEDRDDLMLDLYILKKQGEFSLERVTIGADSLMDDAEAFVKLMQAEAAGSVTVEQLEIKERLRISLFDRLLAPAVNALAGVETVYIAPDMGLDNLPYEILCGEDGCAFGDEHTVVLMECARDFLFDSGVKGSGSLIIGDPQFDLFGPDAEPKTGGAGMKRFSELSEENINELPFSGLEAQVVAAYCGSEPVLGREAKRSRLLSAGGNRNIHIATHGYYDLDEETNPAYSSCLLFAGVCDWLRTGVENEEFGNGLITADDISRLDFSGVELVVLSSCLSGMTSPVFAKGFNGMVGGFASAGVKYAISSRWAVDDMACAVLMEEFYRRYFLLNEDPPAALRAAKNCLRNMTVGELKKRNWLGRARRSRSPSPELEKRLDELSGKRDSARPFRNEVNWAGFVLTRCN